MEICAEVVIGEGIKDNAPGIFKGEHLGTWTPGTVRFDIALDPVDGTTNVAKGTPNAIACIAAASPEPGVPYSLFVEFMDATSKGTFYKERIWGNYK